MSHRRLRFKLLLRAQFKFAFLVLLLGALTRAVFALGLVGSVAFEGALHQLFPALFLGLRYDLIGWAYLVAPAYLVAWAASPFLGEQGLDHLLRVQRAYLFGGFLLLLLLAVCDLGFYSYFQDHINVLFFGLWEDDTQALVITIWKNYAVLWWGLLLSALGACAWWLLGRWHRPPHFSGPMLDFTSDWRRQLATFGAGLVAVAFLARGNFSRLPLSIEDSFISSNEAINKLSVNGLIAMNRALRIRRAHGQGSADFLKQQGYGSATPALSDFHSYRQTPHPFLPELGSLKRRTSEKVYPQGTPPHVIVVAMESFGSMWWDYDSQLPFLGSFAAHAREDYLFRNFLSGDNGTIGSLVMLATGLPARPGARYLSEGEHMKTALTAGAHLPFKHQGYTTRYLYGGKLGWRQMGQYLKGQGWDVLEGAEQVVPKLGLGHRASDEIGNEWGIFDEHLFTHLERELRDAKRPQFFLVLTTTNHPPFEVPANYTAQGLESIPEALRSLFSKSEAEVLRRFKTLQYANQKLGEFLTRLKASAPLADNVVVAVTGDHSFWVGQDEGKAGIVRKYAVPFYLYLPPALRPASWNPDAWGSHEDILPTVYERVLSDTEYWGFGEDLFGERSAALNTAKLAVNQAGAVIDQESFCWDIDKPGLLKPCPESEEHRRLKNYRRANIGLVDVFLKTQGKR